MANGKKPQSAEMHPGPGFRVRHRTQRPPAELVDRFRHFDGPLLSDLMNRLYTMRSDIRSVVGPIAEPLVGPACTVKVFPGDNMMVHAALDIAVPGDVVVVDAGSSPMNAVLGDLVSQKAKHRGIAGFVVDGLVRDIRGIREVGIPVFARGITPIGPLHRGPGEVNYPIPCGGVVVNPGDIIVADDNGVVVVSQEGAEDVAERCRARTELEAQYVSSVKRGDFSNDWVWQSLQSAGCEEREAPEPV